MAIALIIVLLCIMLGVMVYVIASLVKFVVLLGVRHKNEVETLKQIHDSKVIELMKKYDAEKERIVNHLTNDFLIKTELWEENKDPKLVLNFSKQTLLEMPVESDVVSRNWLHNRTDSVTFNVRRFKSEWIDGDYEFAPYYLSDPQKKGQVLVAIAEKLAEYLIKERIIETVIDERFMRMAFRINVFK